MRKGNSREESSIRLKNHKILPAKIMLYNSVSSRLPQETRFSFLINKNETSLYVFYVKVNRNPYNDPM